MMARERVMAWVLTLVMSVGLGFGCASQEAGSEEPTRFEAVVFERSGGIAGRHDVLRINTDRSYAFDVANDQPVARINRSDFERLMDRMSQIDWQTTERDYVPTDGAADYYTYKVYRVFGQGKEVIKERALTCTDVGLNHCPRELRELIYVLQATRARLDRR